MPQAIRFHLDEHVDPAIADGLRRHGIDVTTTLDAGLVRAPTKIMSLSGSLKGGLSSPRTRISCAATPPAYRTPGSPSAASRPVRSARSSKACGSSGNCWSRRRWRTGLSSSEAVTRQAHRRQSGLSEAGAEERWQEPKVESVPDTFESPGPHPDPEPTTHPGHGLPPSSPLVPAIRPPVGARRTGGVIGSRGVIFATSRFSLSFLRKSG